MPRTFEVLIPFAEGAIAVVLLVLIVVVRVAQQAKDDISPVLWRLLAMAPSAPCRLGTK